MSIILGAMGGAGEGMQQFGAQAQKASDAQDLATLESNLALQRSQALEQFKTALTVSTADQQRQQQSARIGSAAQPILQQGIVNRAAAARAQNLGTDSGTPDNAQFTGDASSALAAVQSLPDGPDKDAAMAQLRSQLAASKAANAGLNYGDLTDAEKSQFAPTAQDQRDAFVQAAIQTGDIAPSDVLKNQAAMAGVDAKLALVDARLQIGQLASDAKNAKTQADYEWRMAKLQETIAKAGNGGTDFDKKIQLLKEGGATPADIAAFITERKQPSLEDLANGFLKADPNLGTAKQITPEQAYAKARALRSLSKDIQTPPTPSPLPTPTPAPAQKDYSSLWR